MFIAESSKVIERAVAGGMQPLSLLMEEKFLTGMQPIIDEISRRYPGLDLPVFILPHGQLKKLTGFELTRGALGAFRRPVPASVEDVCRGARRVAVLEDITNHTNVGAIFRSAAAWALTPCWLRKLATIRCIVALCAFPWARCFRFPELASGPTRGQRAPARGRTTAFRCCTAWGSKRPRWRFPTTPSRLTTRSWQPRKNSRLCLARKATALRRTPSRTAITPFGSPWRTRLTASTLRPQAL